jgi:hypothetical protein
MVTNAKPNPSIAAMKVRTDDRNIAPSSRLGLIWRHHVAFSDGML